MLFPRIQCRQKCCLLVFNVGIYAVFSHSVYIQYILSPRIQYIQNILSPRIQFIVLFYWCFSFYCTVLEQVNLKNWKPPTISLFYHDVFWLTKSVTPDSANKYVFYLLYWATAKEKVPCPCCANSLSTTSIRSKWRRNLYVRKSRRVYKIYTGSIRVKTSFVLKSVRKTNLYLSRNS